MQLKDLNSFSAPTIVAYGLGRQSMLARCFCFHTQNAGLKSSTVAVPKPEPLTLSAQFDIWVTCLRNGIWKKTTFVRGRREAGGQCRSTKYKPPACLVVDK